jgi:hypothetical protein
MYITHLMIILTVIHINGYDMMMTVIDYFIFTDMAEGKVELRV